MDVEHFVKIKFGNNGQILEERKQKRAEIKQNKIEHKNNTAKVTFFLCFLLYFVILIGFDWIIRT